MYCYSSMFSLKIRNHKQSGVTASEKAPPSFEKRTFPVSCWWKNCTQRLYKDHHTYKKIRHTGKTGSEGKRFFQQEVSPSSAWSAIQRKRTSFFFSFADEVREGETTCYIKSALSCVSLFCVLCYPYCPTKSLLTSKLGLFPCCESHWALVSSVYCFLDPFESKQQKKNKKGYEYWLLLSWKHCKITSFNCCLFYCCFNYYALLLTSRKKKHLVCSLLCQLHAAVSNIPT